MQPADITLFTQELAIRWVDGREDFIPLESLRRFCPCAACMGETDIFGTTYRPPQRPYATESFQLRKLPWVGNYAVQPCGAMAMPPDFTPGSGFAGSPMPSNPR